MTLWDVLEKKRPSGSGDDRNNDYNMTPRASGPEIDKSRESRRGGKSQRWV
jgi:hypothetical protein